MIKLDGTNITLSRGDYGQIIMTLNSAGEPYILVDGDYLLFTVKSNTTSKTPVIEKHIPANGTATYAIELMPNDTKDLASGNYVWDVRIVPRSGKIHTPMYQAVFRLVRTVGSNE